MRTRRGDLNHLREASYSGNIESTTAGETAERFDRRRLMQGAALAALGATGVFAISSKPSEGLISTAAAQGQPPAPKAFNYPGKSDKLVLLGDRPLVAETPESLLDDDTTPIDKFFVRNNGQIPERSQGPGRLEDHHRRRGQQQDRDHARRTEDEIQAGDAAHGAGMRRQRPLVLHAAGARQSVDQRRRRLRRMDRRAAHRRAQDGGREAVGGIHRRIMAPTASLRRRRARTRSRAACRSRRRWTPTT